MNNRATGRTFRMLLRAILAASDAEPGTIITVAGHGNNEAHDLQKGAMCIISGYLHSQGVKFSSRNRTIEIVGAGVLEFISYPQIINDEKEGKVFPYLFLDHFVSL